VAAPLLTLRGAGVEIALSAVDVAEIDISEAGGVADVFLTLMPRAGAAMGAVRVVPGSRLDAEFCGITLRTAELRPPLSGHLYIAETTVLRAEALRAVWQGRARCDTLGAEVFEHGN
jgi:hypothetical protein